MAKLLGKLTKDRSGATAVEYVFIATFIGLAILGSVTAMFDQVHGLYAPVVAFFESLAG